MCVNASVLAQPRGIASHITNIRTWLGECRIVEQSAVILQQILVNGFHRHAGSFRLCDAADYRPDIRHQEDFAFCIFFRTQRQASISSGLQVPLSIPSKTLECAFQTLAHILAFLCKLRVSLPFG